MIKLFPRTTVPMSNDPVEIPKTLRNVGFTLERTDWWGLSFILRFTRLSLNNKIIMRKEFSKKYKIQNTEHWTLYSISICFTDHNITINTLKNKNISTLHEFFFYFSDRHRDREKYDFCDFFLYSTTNFNLLLAVG